MSVHVHVNPAPSSDLPCPPELLESAVRAVFTAEGHPDGELSLTFLEDAAITELNARYLDHDHPTDVLSFAMHDPEDAPMGDVYIGYDQALRQAAESNVSPAEELVRLAIHGTLHVLGHAHPEGAGGEKSAMWRQQERILTLVLEGSEA